MDVHFGRITDIPFHIGYLSTLGRENIMGILQSLFADSVGILSFIMLVILLAIPLVIGVLISRASKSK